MSLSVFQRTIVVQDSGGLVVVPGSEVEVFFADTSTRPDLFADPEGNTPLTNPLNADGQGFVRFYVAPGEYDISATGNGTIQWDRVRIVGAAATRDVGSEPDEIPDNATLLNTYGIRPTIDVRPTLDLDFANNKYSIYDGFGNSFTEKPYGDILTVTRATVETGTDPTGKVRTAGVDKLPLVFKDGVAQGAQITGSVTNLLVHSEDSDNWIDISGIDFEAGNNSPLASFYNRAVYDGSIRCRFRVSSVPVTENTNYVLSFYVSSDFTATNLIISGGALQLNIDLDSLTINTNSGSPVTIEHDELTHGRRVFLFFTAPSTVNINPFYVLTNNPNSTSNTQTPDTVGAFAEFTGFMMYVGTSKMPYVPTEASQITKPATDVVRQTDWDGFNLRKMTFCVEWDNTDVESVGHGFVPNYNVLALKDTSNTAFRGFGLVVGVGANNREVRVYLRDDTINDNQIVGTSGIGRNRAVFSIDRDLSEIKAVVNGGDIVTLAMTNDIADSFFAQLRLVDSSLMSGSTTRLVRNLTYQFVGYCPKVLTNPQMIALASGGA